MSDDPNNNPYLNPAPQPGGYTGQYPVTGPGGNLPTNEPTNYPRDNYGVTPPGGPITQGPGPYSKLTDFPPPPPPTRSKGGWKIIVPIVLVIVLILAAASAVVFARAHQSSTVVVATATVAATQPVATPTTAPTAQPTAVSTTTPGATATIAATGTVATTPAPGSSSNYSAAQPGPGCDTNGGIWTPAGPISNINCGTTIIISASESPGYLYLQLPPGEAYASNNTIAIAGGELLNEDSNTSNCVGLAEQDANKGFLAEYCGNGGWFIYSISSAGAIIKTLASNITSTRQLENLSLTFKGSTLSFTIDTEVHTLSISPIQPIKVAIAGEVQLVNDRVSVDNFSYTTNS